MTEPFAHTSGPRSARIVAVGEAWGEQEELWQRPFVGSSGQEFWRMLGEAWPSVSPEAHALAASAFRNPRIWLDLREQWLESAGLLLTNVLALRPPNNSLEALCVSKKELPSDYSYPPLSKGKYLKREFLSEVARLHSELEEIRPNCVLALGNTACWAVLRATNIGSIRGAVTQSVGLNSVLKVLPTYHPAGVMRNWSWRPIVIVDLMKALRESAFPEVRRPRRTVLVNPTLEEIHYWFNGDFKNARIVSVDIETYTRQIKCIGFAIRRDSAIVIPFTDDRVHSRSYWSTQHDELAAWEVVRDVLASPVQKLFQNGLYDIQYLARMGFQVRNATADTMLLHHSLFPELQKGLGFMGSIYSDEASWKLMRKSKPDSEKRDE